MYKTSMYAVFDILNVKKMSKKVLDIRKSHAMIKKNSMRGKINEKQQESKTWEYGGGFFHGFSDPADYIACHV